MSETSPKITGTSAQWLTDRVIRAVLWLLLALPYRWRVPLCGWVVARVLAPLAGWPRRIRANLALTQPDLPQAEVDRMVRAVPDNIGRSLIEMYSDAAFIAEATRHPLEGPGLAVLEQARAEGRPVVIATGHFGNYAAVTAAMKARGFPLGALYRQMANPYFNEHYVRAIGTMVNPLFERGRAGMGRMLRHLRNGGMLFILPDQRMISGQALSFFGQPALTALSAAEMALKYDAPLIPSYAIRQPDGLSFRIVIDAPVPVGDAATMTQALNDSLESIVRQHPEQWLWVHRRWKP